MLSANASSPTPHGIRTACDLMVMPRSRSMSIRSRYCARIARASTTPVSCSMRSASVDLPWSMCAMMQKLRSSSGGVAAGWMRDEAAAPGIGDTRAGSWDRGVRQALERALLAPSRRTVTVAALSGTCGRYHHGPMTTHPADAPATIPSDVAPVAHPAAALDHLALLADLQAQFLATIPAVDPSTRVPWCGRWR